MACAFSPLRFLKKNKKNKKQRARILENMLGKRFMNGRLKQRVKLARCRSVNIAQTDAREISGDCPFFSLFSFSLFFTHPYFISSFFFEMVLCVGHVRDSWFGILSQQYVSLLLYPLPLEGIIVRHRLLYSS